MCVCVFPQCELCIHNNANFVCIPRLRKCAQTIITVSKWQRVFPQSTHLLPHYSASLHQHGGLTSLKRFQCLILRLYCEMVDSHCSSSMKFPVFSASLTLFTSVWKVEPTSITSGTRRHTLTVISTMVADKNTLRAPAVGGPLLGERGGGC